MLIAKNFFYIYSEFHVTFVSLLPSSYQEKKHKTKEGQESKDNSDKKERVITIRPLNMEDLKEAKNQVTTFLVLP